MYLQGSVYDLGLSFLNIDEQSWKETDDYQIVKNHYFQKLKKKKERKKTNLLKRKGTAFFFGNWWMSDLELKPLSHKFTLCDFTFKILYLQLINVPCVFNGSHKNVYII